MSRNSSVGARVRGSLAREAALCGVVAALWLSSPSPSFAQGGRPDPGQAEPEPWSAPTENPRPVVLWTEGDVAWRHEEHREAGWTSAVVGERLAPGTLVEAAAGGRAILLAGSDLVATLVGPGRWLIETARLTSLPPGDGATGTGLPRAARPRLDRLQGYREGPLPLLEPLSSQPMLSESPLPMTLALTHPSTPVSRTVRPEIRWHWPYEGGRFDLTIEETDGTGGESARLIERWRNLAGRQHLPVAELERGRTYRISLSHAGDSGPTTSARSPIVDRHSVHILATSEAVAVDGALASLDALQAGARRFRPEIDVLRARLLESHGLWDEAEAVWTGLAILYPGREDVLAHAMRLHARTAEP